MQKCACLYRAILVYCYELKYEASMFSKECWWVRSGLAGAVVHICVRMLPGVFMLGGCWARLRFLMKRGRSLGMRQRFLVCEVFSCLFLCLPFFGP